MSPDKYEHLLAECDITSRQYSILKNAVIVTQQNGGTHKVVEIVCNKDEAAKLIGVTSQLYPDAISALSHFRSR